MLDNAHYNKVKILHELSKTAWFIKECAKRDAKEAGHTECLKQYEALEKDLGAHIDKLHESLCKLCMK